MIKTIYFDIGNVLIFFSHQKMIDQLSDCTGMTHAELKNLFFGNSLLMRYETGHIDAAEIYQFLYSHSRRSFSFYEMLLAASDIFTPNEELWEIVTALKQEKTRLILLSNISECHYNKIYSDYPIFQIFDEKILSFEVRACKPHPHIFTNALAKSLCHPSECFYTDDIHENIKTARKKGLPGEIYTDVSSLRDHLINRGCKFLA